MRAVFGQHLRELFSRCSHSGSIPAIGNDAMKAGKVWDVWVSQQYI